MGTTTKLPGVDAASEVLGLSLDEIARALRVDYSTFYRWRGGTTPGGSFLDRMEQLQELAGTVERSLARNLIPEWLQTPASVFGGRTPREMVLAGRVETVLGALLSYQHMFIALAEAERGRRKPSFLSMCETGDLPLPTVAALAMLDADVDSLAARMQTPESKAASEKALKTRPRVRLDSNPEGGSS